MKRDIKFRAWSESEKRFALNDEFMWVTRFGVLYENPKAMCVGVDSNIKLMQYTGLRDKNSVEIYEGDVVSLSEEFDEGRFYAVEYQVNGYWLDGWDGNEYGFPDGSDLEVIGNIFESPELLEAES